MTIGECGKFFLATLNRLHVLKEPLPNFTASVYDSREEIATKRIK